MLNSLKSDISNNLKVFLIRIIDFLKTEISKESGNFIYWLPVIFGSGILVFFLFDNEPNHLYISIIAFLISLVFLLVKNPIYKLMAKILLTFTLGLLCITIRTNIVESQLLGQEIKFAKITARIDSITPLEHGHRVVFSDIRIRDLPSDKTPKKIRLTVKTKLLNVGVGDIVKFKANLTPLPAPVVYGGYDFARFAYYKQIGAVGFTVTNIRLVKKTDNIFIEKINNFRYHFSEHVLKILGGSSGSIATALMIGDYGGLDKTTLIAMREAGLAHLLAVSGMHLSLVVFICFFFFRFILARFTKFALKYNIKKIAAFFSLFASLLYLLISGIQIAATRAFIMASFIIIAIIFDKVVVPLRSVVLAALIIMVFWPESLLSASFHMSFAAVLGLIICYSKFSNVIYQINKEGRIWQKFLVYVGGLSISSLIASIATAPFSIYHFNQFSILSVISNLIAVPITSFFLMPLAVFSFVLYPIGLDFITLNLMGWGISIITKSALYLTQYEYAVINVKKISDLSMILILLASFIYSFSMSKLKYSSGIFLLLGLIFAYYTKKPSIILNIDKQYALVNNSENITFSQKKIPKYTRENWLKIFGVKDFFEDSNILRASSNSLTLYKTLDCGFVNSIIKNYSCNIDHEMISKLYYLQDEAYDYLVKPVGGVNIVSHKFFQKENISIFINKNKYEFYGSLNNKCKRKWYKFLPCNI